jgi:hypothetical protein
MNLRWQECAAKRNGAGDRSARRLGCPFDHTQLSHTVRFQELYGNPGYLGHDERLREYANVGDFTKQAPTRGFIRGFVPFSLHHTQRVESAILPERKQH